MAADNELIQRRDFFRRLARAGAGIALTGAIGWQAWDRTGPPAQPPLASRFTIPVFALEGVQPKICIARGNQRGRGPVDPRLALSGRTLCRRDQAHRQGPGQGPLPQRGLD